MTDTDFERLFAFIAAGATLGAIVGSTHEHEHRLRPAQDLDLGRS